MSKTVWGPLYYMILKRSTVSDWPRPLFEVRGCASVQTCVYKSVPVCLWNEPGFILSIYIYFYIGMCCVFVLMKQLFYTRSWESLQLKKTVSCWRQLFNDIFVFNWLTALVFFSLKCAYSPVFFYERLCFLDCRLNKTSSWNMAAPGKRHHFLTFYKQTIDL